MVSYEKIRQSLRSWTLFIAWINALAVLGKVFAIISYVMLANNLNTFKEVYDAETYQTIAATTNIWNLIIIIVALIANIAIAFLAFKNLSKIKEDAPSLTPYRLGLIYTVVYNVAGIILAVVLGSTLSVTTFLLPVIFLALYGYVYAKAGQLLDKDEEENDEAVTEAE
ncbi:hypothetical protein CAC02_04885 [Streptococcus gallolyticus]|uniref:DUF2975 domain-containing protein n=1 Tax=Streptococcus gallolyticus TaxID=315405 RepID=A0A368UEL5_9STRE|nr:hypothetical protein [Streptococcus gallolyticus]RCW17126.1 hypothetical protein CAC02_04885 [Streptococcus gallolyticus]